MNRLKKMKKTKVMYRLLFFIISLLFLGSFVFFTKSVVSLSGIETLIRYLVLIFFAIYFVMFVDISLEALSKNHKKVLAVFYIITFLISCAFAVGYYYIDMVYSSIGIVNTDDNTYTSVLVTLKDTKKIKSVGILEDEDDIIGSILARRIIKKKKLDVEEIKYTDNNELIAALYNREVDGVFLPGSYVSIFDKEDEYLNVSSETKIYASLSEKFEIDEDDNTSSKSLTEPFTVLVLGVDTDKDISNPNQGFNGDVITLITFNPNTLKATLTSFPRDTYVPITCNDNRYYKINSSAASGTQCVIDTVENFTGITIDYYVKINFTGVVELVDAVGGVEVDVEPVNSKYNHEYYCGGKFCEQDSHRDWNSPIYLDFGYQNLNGEEALAYARCRALYNDGDIARNRHQQQIITALANKIIKNMSLSDVKDILSAISNNIATNMSTNDILSMYSILKNMLKKSSLDGDFFTIQKTLLETYSIYAWEDWLGGYRSGQAYYEKSYNEVIDALKINLEIKKYSPITTISYSYDDTYDDIVIGKGSTEGYTESVLTNFVGQTKSWAESYCKSNNIKCSYKYVDEESEYYNADVKSDLIGYQSIHLKTLMRYSKEITLYINE